MSKNISAVLAILVSLSISLNCKADENKKINESLKAELESMYETDQSQRVKMDEISKKYGCDSAEMKELWKKQNEIDGNNIRRLVEIIESHGWPGRSLVGKKASDGAFLILQHAELSYQKKYIPLVNKAVAQGELKVQMLALLEDRVLMREGKKQIYGTQLTMDESTSRWVLYPIEDEANVDKRRAKVGLPPLAEYLKHFGLEYKSTQ